MSFLLEKAVEVLFEPARKVVGDTWKYFWNYKVYVNSLELECKYLKHGRDGLEHEFEEARDNAVNVEKGVTEWFVAVDKVTEEASVLQEKKKFIINPCKRYKIGKEAHKMTQSIRNLETRRSRFGRIYYRTAPGKVMGLYSGIHYHVTPSRDAMLKQINKALLDPSVKVVGVYGPSGVGKSTLLGQVMEQVLTRSLDYDFDEVAMATVSQDPKLEKIQDDLAYRLGLKFENEKGVEQKASQLSRRLEQHKKILIILDDIWKELKLESLGINPAVHPIKLLLTSRTEETLKKGMNCQENFELKAFSKKEAMELFEKILGHPIEDKSTVELVSRELVEECACLPVYIVPLATKLKTYNPKTWKKFLNELRESNKKQRNKLIEEALANEEVKRLFLLCGQIGSQIIAIEDLLVYGIGLGLFKGMTIEEYREKLMTLIEKLKSFCLLEGYGDDRVKIHDVMSETSLSMASEKQRSLVLRDGKKLRAHLDNKSNHSDCVSISLPFVDEITNGLPEILQHSELEMFLSYTNENCQIHFPNSFFSKTNKLQVLDIFGVSFGGLPSSIRALNGLHTLCLDQCKINNLKEIGELKMLQVLTLRGSEIDRFPKEIAELTDLRFLDLRRCYELQVIESGALEKLIMLEELYLPESYEKWESKGQTNASLNELSGMTRLQSLSICIPDFSALPRDFCFSNLKRFKILVKVKASEIDDSGYVQRELDRKKGKETGKDSVQSSHQSDEMGKINYFVEYDKAKTLKLKLDHKDQKIIWEDWIQTALCGAKKLELFGWIEHENSITDLCGDCFSKLRHIIVRYSPGIQYVFRPNDRFLSSTLESLDLHMLRNLEKIYQGNLLANSMTNLRTLRIKSCHELKNLLSLPVMKELLRIEEIEVSNCKKLSDIVSFCEVGRMECKRGKSRRKFDLLVLKSLRKLMLSDLPKISNLCAEEIKTIDINEDSFPLGFLDGRQVFLPLLECLSLCKLPNLERIFQGKYPVKLKRLRFLEVKSCKKLVNVVEEDVQLTNLEVLTIESCEAVKTVFNSETFGTGKDVKEGQVLKRLMKLKLVDLKNLETIWHTNIKESWLVRNLNQLEVSCCPKLTYLFTSSMTKSLQNISQISVDGCKKMEKIFVGDNGYDDIGDGDTMEFSSLIELRISNMDNLEMFARGDRSFYFPRLQKLEIKQCHKMSTFVHPSNNDQNTCCGMSKCKALALKVRSVASRRRDHDRADYQSFFGEKVVFPSLGKLVLSSLNIKSIWQSAPSEDSFGKLGSIEIEDCSCSQILLEDEQQDSEEITSSTLKKPESAQIMEKSPKKQVLGFPYLTDLRVDRCGELSYLFSDAIARTLFELKEMRISDCEKMSVVVSTRKEEKMMFHKLHFLMLSELPSLKSFSMGSAEHCFPFLQELQISKCANFEAFIMRPPNSSPGVKATHLFDYKVIIPNLEKLVIQKLKLEKIVHNEFPVELFSKLKFLVVEECDKLSTIIPHFILPNLKSLELRELPGLEHICGNETFSEYFPFDGLNILKVEGCHCLKNMFTVSTVKILEKLQELRIKNCELMNQVIEWRSEPSIEGTNKIIFPQLSLLELCNLPNLESFCSRCMTSWPLLAKMEIRYCRSVKAFAADSESHCEPLFLLEKVAFPKLEALVIHDMENMTELWNISREGKDLEPSSEAFPKLKTLEILRCHQLSTIFPSKMVREVRKLEELTIGYCDSVKQVFQLIDNKSSNPLSFSLKKLELKRLQSLDCVWDIENGEVIDLSFHELQEINVYSCSLQYLFPVSMLRNLYKLEQIYITDCENIMEIVKKEGSSDGDNFDGSDRPQFVSFPKVTTLTLINLMKLKSFITCSDFSEWPSLKFLEICGCPEAKMSGGSDNIDLVKKVGLFSNLKSIVTDMEGLQEMQSLDGFVDVTNLCIEHIDETKAQRFPWKLLERFHSLEFLWIFDSAFEELFQPENEEADGDAKEEREEIAPYRCSSNRNQEHRELQSLRELQLGNLDKLKQVYREDSMMAEVLDIVKKLEVSSCDSLKNLFPTSASFSNLAMIAVEWCDGMEYLLTSSAARCLRQLTVLHVRWCKNMKEIVRQDHDENGNRSGADNVDAEICFPRLKELRLEYLRELKSFSSSSSCGFEFSSLESVYLEDVSKLEVFCKGGFTAPLLHDIDVRENESIDEQNRLKTVMELDD